MNHVELLKRAFFITWRYRALWLFGFLLALCGGGGGGGGGNFNYPGGGSSTDLDDFGGGQVPNLPDFDPGLIITLIVVIIVGILLLAIAAVVVRVVSRTALIGMVRQIKESEAVTVGQGWRLGWSGGAWRLFLVNLLIGIPVGVLSLILLLLAFSPLLLLITGDTVWMVMAVVLTILAVLMVALFLMVVQAVITPFKELAWRGTVLDQQGPVDSLRRAFGLVKRRFKDIVLVWLIMIGVALGWGLVALVVVLPVSLIAAVLAGGIPAGLTYLVSRSVLAMAIVGIPLAVIVLIVTTSFLTAFYLIYQSSVWTLVYLNLFETEEQQPESSSQPEPPPLISEAQVEA